MSNADHNPSSILPHFKTLQASLARYELAEVDSIVTTARVCLLTPGFAGFSGEKFLALGDVLKRKEALEAIIADADEVAVRSTPSKPSTAPTALRTAPTASAA